jgi:Fe(3+) dicitrate transport protein
MMKYQAYSILFLLFTFSGFAQHFVSGTVVSENGEKLRSVEIFETITGTQQVSDLKGEFLFEFQQSGSYNFLFYKEGYLLSEVMLTPGTPSTVVTLQSINALSEVVISNQREKLSALNKLRDVEGTAIYAGRKSEVISLDKITANKAANNARQIYAQVVGLTINESSDGGLQLSIGGRGLDPSRTSNFNTRQNGYDISADVLGYPESYYATPTEALQEIQVVRGAASLQYGTQFGGLVNFVTKKPSERPIELTTRNTVGSYGLFSNFTSLSGTTGKFSYYTFYNYKQGNGFRPNSEFESQNFFANLNYKFTDRTSLHLDYTFFDYLAQQPGGLTDLMFSEAPQQSNRSRNWFDVNWNLFALRLQHKFGAQSDFSLQLFGLDASRKAVGFRTNRVATADIPGTGRDLIIGNFQNYGAEARFLQKYTISKSKNVFLIGAKYYQADNSGFQGPGSSGDDANFSPAKDEFPFYRNESDYKYPNLNLAVFGENIFRITPSFSLTPGFRYENITTKAVGSYRRVEEDLAGNVIFDETIPENNVKRRDFFLFGLGASYKPAKGIELYGNVSQNYRSVTFNDIRTATPGQYIAPDITDEKGYTSDIGLRGQLGNYVTFDTSVYAMYYNDKIGEYLSESPYGRFRDNIGTALTYGFESMIDWSLSRAFFSANENFIWNTFINLAITDSEYLKSDIPNIKGNNVEFVPLFNFKSGSGIGYKNFLSSVQLTYVSEQFTDAENRQTDSRENISGIFGQIPAYFVADFSASYKWQRWKLEGGVNNFSDNKYFTRRATGYPGPGIIPSDFRSFYLTLELVF